MVSLSKKTADPLQFLVEKPLCAYPSMYEFILRLGLDEQQRDKLLVELHRFEHALLTEGFTLYSAVGRQLGSKVLDRAIRTIGEEYPKWEPK
jgi:hypothetical protein